MQEKERRNFYRLKAYHLVKYRIFSGGQEIGAPVLGAIKDIGAEGACLRTEEELPLGTQLKLEINLPGTSAPVSALAKVLWVNPIGKTMRYEVGTQFIEIDESMRKVIDENAKFVQARIQELEEKRKKRGFFDFFKRGGK